MILVDTSVWISHLRYGHSHLRALLQEGLVWSHKFIIGEIACGNLKNRKEILYLLNKLPLTQNITSKEALAFIESRKLYGKGIGYIDIHLLASACLSNATIWTLDKKLEKAAELLKIRYLY